LTGTEDQPPAWWDGDFRRKTAAIEMSLRYTWACQRQIHRFADGLAARPTMDFDYSKGIVERVDTQRIYDVYRADGYLVAVLANQALGWLHKAEKETGRDLGIKLLQPGTRKQVRTLRDVYEHWVDHVDSFRDNKPKKKAGKRFLAENTNYASPGEGWGIKVHEGPHLDNLKLNDLFAALRRAEDLLIDTRRDIFASVGLTVPDGDYKPMAQWHYFPGAAQVEPS
jgi:hypothetical protein